jgi:hypothetical protein
MAQGSLASRERPKCNPGRQKIKRAQRMKAAHDAGITTKNIGMLAVYLIVVGIIGLTGIGPGILLPILALIAGIFILLGK